MPRGRPRDWASIAGKKGTILVLFRSAKWCPFCQAQLKSLKDVQASLAQQGYGLAALSYDPPEVLAGFAAKAGIGYTLCSDQKSAMIDGAGLARPGLCPAAMRMACQRLRFILLVDAARACCAGNRWRPIYKLPA
ncbi:MAG: redoxin domain-containing protein [Sphingomonadales bacterium]|nr:redoxin domain-containing protein [Sphingomonadales bacterium]